MSIRHLLSCLLCVGSIALSAQPNDCVARGEAVLASAARYDGVREATGHNDGVEVEHMLAMVGMPKGCSWCGAFVYTAMCEAGVGCVSAGVRAFAWAPAWHPPARRVWTKARGINSKFAGSGERLVMPGDVFGLYFTNLGRIGHVGLVVRDEGKFLVTLEGNTNDAGSREGDGVFHKRRRKDQVYCVSRWNC